MISLRKIANFGRIIKLQQKQVALFADNWKERDEAAEKVYITRAESNLFWYFRINHEKTPQKNRSRRSWYGKQLGIIWQKTQRSYEKIQNRKWSSRCLDCQPS